MNNKFINSHIQYSFKNPVSLTTKEKIKKEWIEKGLEERIVEAMIKYHNPDTLTVDSFNLTFNFFDLEYFNENILPNIEAVESMYSSNADKIVELEHRLSDEAIFVYYEIAEKYLLDGQQEPTLVEKIESVKKLFPSKENIVALQSLVNELAQNYAFLVRLDVQFCDDIVEKRRLVALLMMMNEKLRPFMERMQHQLDTYIDNYYIYKQLVPYIKIETGTTHGPWRHLVDPKKKCLVLTAKNCEIAASEQLNRTYGESESKFLVLQGLSMKATDDNAEVHYLEV